MKWRFLVSEPMQGADNMALDEALAGHAARTGEAALRVYGFNPATLSLGRNQVARGVFDADRARAQGVDIVRRPTGGRALWHDREVTYSVVVPFARRDSLRESYRRTNELLIAGLRAMGVSVAVAGRTRPEQPPASAPCFALPSEGEIVVHGRKLVGSAMLRTEGALLQHGSILVDDDQWRIASVATEAIGVTAPAATLRQELGRSPSVNEVAAALLDALGATEQVVERLDVSELSAAALEEAAARYRSPEWTWRM